MRYFRILIAGILWFAGPHSLGAAQGKLTSDFSILGRAFTANAGGQDARALRYSAQQNYEFFAFSNAFLTTGIYPLSGLGLSKSFNYVANPILYANLLVGGGFSTAGPMAELTMSYKIFRILRIDLSTHFYRPSERVILWNYPFWFGIALPF